MDQVYSKIRWAFELNRDASHFLNNSAKIIAGIFTGETTNYKYYA